MLQGKLVKTLGVVLGVAAGHLLLLYLVLLLCRHVIAGEMGMETISLFVGENPPRGYEWTSFLRFLLAAVLAVFASSFIFMVFVMGVVASPWVALYHLMKTANPASTIPTTSPNASCLAQAIMTVAYTVVTVSVCYVLPIWAFFHYRLYSYLVVNLGSGPSGLAEWLGFMITALLCLIALVMGVGCGFAWGMYIVMLPLEHKSMGGKLF